MEIQERILEISQATNPNGRRKVKFALHEIYPDRTHWNRNGITYLEQYTRDNADSVKGMPLCAEFLDDDKDVPYGHGLTGHIKTCLFLRILSKWVHLKIGVSKMLK